MAKLSAVFDSGQHEDMQSGFDPIPAGEYLSMLVESELKTTKKKDGQYIKLKFKIMEGEFKGRFIWTNLNLINPNPVAVEIAQKELATLCRSCGKAVIKDTQELHGVPILMKVKIVPAKGDFPANNAPTGYAPATVGATAGNPAEDDAEDAEDAEDDKTAQADIDVPW